MMKERGSSDPLFFCLDFAGVRDWLTNFCTSAFSIGQSIGLVHILNRLV